MDLIPPLVSSNNICNITDTSNDDDVLVNMFILGEEIVGTLDFSDDDRDNDFQIVDHKMSHHSRRNVYDSELALELSGFYYLGPNALTSKDFAIHH